MAAPQVAVHTDVLIIGAGVSGIGAACHLTRECPDLSYAILERRERVGGTWDLFRYPGVRSDSDMYTFGYAFRPWTDTRMLADGPSIRRYVADTAREYGVDEHIIFGRRVTSARWSSAEGRWTVESVDEASGTTHSASASFLFGCTGYYDYDRGYRPDFPGEDRFTGTLVHPQHWPADLDHTGKRVVIIGSGATAITLVPALAEHAAHVTMLQRSPSYVLSMPGKDNLSAGLDRLLPSTLVYKLARVRNIVMQRSLYALARKRPSAVRNLVLRGAQRQLKGSCDLSNFTPAYDPWDQRLCIIPDGDLFKAIRRGDADVVTQGVRTFTETGVDLQSGEHLDADIVVIATGLAVQMLGGAQLVVDDAPVSLREKVTYKGVLVEDVPNAALIFGYVNASWTLKADLAASYVCRLLNHMRRRDYTQVVARAGAGDRAGGSVLGALNSGYVRRGDAELPRQGTRGPWKVTNDYLRDFPMLRHRSIEDDVLAFTGDDAHVKPGPRPRPAAVRSGGTATFRR